MKQYFSFQWHITDDCDQRCKHCYIFSEDTCKKPDSMTWQQMQDTFYNCLDFCKVYGRLPYFYITGGDPILHPDFWKLLGLLKEHEIPFTILGNPFHLTDAVCRKLKDYGCEKYQLSLDGMEKTHDWFRKPGSFAVTLEKIGCINRAGIRSVIMTTVSGTNIGEIPDIIDAAVAAGANVFAYERDEKRLEAVAKEFGCFVPLSEVEARRYGVVFNCTGIGMHKTVGMTPFVRTKAGEQPVGEELLSLCDTAVDLIYVPKESEFLRIARSLGKKTVEGGPMLFYQAYYGDCIYVGREPKAEEAKRLYEEYLKTQAD